MCLSEWFKRRRRRRRARIYEGPSMEIDGGTRISYDTGAPKEIASRELTRFSCRFSALSLIEEDTRLPQGVYHFSATKGEDGITCTVECKNSRVLAGGERKSIRSDDILVKIEALLRKYNVAQHNGSHYKVSGLPNFYGAKVDAAYASGETLYCYNNQDPFLPAEMIRELCRLFGIAPKNEI